MIYNAFKLPIVIALTLFTALFQLGAAEAQPRRGMTVSPYIAPAEIEVLGGWNVNLVRYQLAWGDEVDTAGALAYRLWLSEALDYLDTLLPVFEANGIKVALDLHTPPGGFADKTGPAQFRLFSESWAQSELVNTWQTITTRYKDDDRFWGFDILNEPAQRTVASGLKNWNDLAPDVINAIRAIDADRMIVVEPIYGNLSHLGKLKLAPTENLLISIHLYYPLSFIHQGVYPGTPIGKKYPTKKLNRKALKNYLSRLVKYQKKTGYDVWIGEFTAPRWAPGKSSFNYLRDAITLFEKQGWDWTYHSFREANVWSIEHGSDPEDDTMSPTLTDRAKLLIGKFEKNLL